MSRSGTGPRHKFPFPTPTLSRQQTKFRQNPMCQTDTTGRSGRSEKEATGRRGRLQTEAPPGPLTDLLFEGTHHARLLDVTAFRFSISASIILFRSQSATRETAQDDTQPDSSSDRGRQSAARGASWLEGTPAYAVSIRPECRLLAFRQNRDCRRDRHPACFCMHCRLPGLTRACLSRHIRLGSSHC
jgi:hypothetical protein